MDTEGVAVIDSEMLASIPAKDTSSPYQSRYTRQIGGRALSTSCSMLFQAAHTVLLKNKDNFASNTIPLLADTVDAMLSLSWVTDKQGNPRISYCFRIYQPVYDHKTNTVTFGKADRCVFAKDGSYLPFAGASGKIFDHLKNTTNYKTFLSMDATMETASRSHKLRAGGPRFSNCMLAFKPNSEPLFEEAFVDKAARSALELDAVGFLKQSDRWFLSPGGTISEMAEDEGREVTMVVFGDDVIVEIPKAAHLADNVSVGSTVPKGTEIAKLQLSKPWHTWDLASKDIGDPTAEWVLIKLWNESRIPHDDYVCICNKYVPLEYATKAVDLEIDPSTGITKKVIYRDMRDQVGRDHYLTRNGSVVSDRSDFQAGIDVWNMGGLVSKGRLSFAGPGFIADFYSVKEQWNNYFYSNN